MLVTNLPIRVNDDDPEIVDDWEMVFESCRLVGVLASVIVEASGLSVGVLGWGRSC